MTDAKRHGRLVIVDVRGHFETLRRGAVGTTSSPLDASSLPKFMAARECFVYGTIRETPWMLKGVAAEVALQPMIELPELDMDTTLLVVDGQHPGDTLEYVAVCASFLEGRPSNPDLAAAMRL